MNASMHPPVDQIADFEEGLLSTDEAREVSVHLDGCTQCRAVVGRLTEVSHLLGASGREAPAMPGDVAASLAAAFARAQAEREAGVAALADRRTPSEPAPEASRRPRRRLLLGAAAAVAVFAVGGALASNGLPGRGSGDSAAGGATSRSSADQDAAGEQASKAPAPKSGKATDENRLGAESKPRLDRANVDEYAAALAGGQVKALRAPVRCVLPTDSTNDASIAGPPSARVLFDGHDAVLEVDRQRRQLTVLSCPGASRVLFRSAY